MAAAEPPEGPAHPLRQEPAMPLLHRLAAAAAASDVPSLSELQALLQELTGAKNRVDERRTSVVTARIKALGDRTRATSEASGPSTIAAALTGRLADSRAGTPALSARGKGSIASIDEDVKPDLVPLSAGVPAPLDRVLREASVATASGSRHSSPENVHALAAASPRPSRLGDGRAKRKRDSVTGTPAPSSDHDTVHLTEPDSPDVPLHQPNKNRRLESIPTGSPSASPFTAPPAGPASLLVPPQASHLARTSSAISATSGIASSSVPPAGGSTKRKGATPMSRLSSATSFATGGLLPGLNRTLGGKDGELDEVAVPGVKPKLRFGLPQTQVQDLALPATLLTASTAAPASGALKSARSALGGSFTDDFSFPTRSLVPPAPVSRPPIPHPKVQSEVTGDFSKTKQPGSQVGIHQFQSWVNENYLRTYGEDDLAFLAPRREENAMLQVPPLGKHYSEVWREDDTGEYATPVPGDGADGTGAGTAGNALDYPPMKRVRRDELNDAAVHGEKVEVGPVTERLIASLRAVEPTEPTEADRDKERELKREHKARMAKGKAKALEEGGPDVEEPGWVEGGAGQAPMQLDSVELESRIKRELKYLGILADDEIDWSQRVDDQISSALRATQRAYRAQHAVNEARRARLAELVRERMAWQEYESLKDGLDRAVEQGWIRRQRSEVRKKAASRKKGDEAKDKEKEEAPRVPLPEPLVAALDKRQRFIDTVGSIFEGPDRGRGYYRRIPDSSIYADVVDGTANALDELEPVVTRNGLVLH